MADPLHLHVGFVTLVVGWEVGRNVVGCLRCGVEIVVEVVGDSVVGIVVVVVVVGDCIIDVVVVVGDGIIDVVVVVGVSVKVVVVGGVALRRGHRLRSIGGGWLKAAGSAHWVGRNEVTGVISHRKAAIMVRMVARSEVIVIVGALVEGEDEDVCVLWVRTGSIEPAHHPCAE
jgi:hypothetical protein